GELGRGDDRGARERGREGGPHLTGSALPVGGRGQDGSVDILESFSAPTAAWFRGAFARPTAAQEGAWGAISQGRHALVVAPTGSGKTLSAFLWAIDRVFREGTAGGPLPGFEARSEERRVGKAGRFRWWADPDTWRPPDRDGR